MNSFLRVCVILMIVAVPRITGPAQSGDPIQKADIAAINRLREELRTRIRQGDVAGAMEYFTEDAIYLRPGDPADVGKDVIRKHWEEGLKQTMVDIEYRADEVGISGDLAFVRGTLTLRATPKGGGASITAEHRYIWILRREEAHGWRIARYMRHQAPGEN